MIKGLYELDPARARQQHDLRGKLDQAKYQGLVELDDFDAVASGMYNQRLVHVVRDLGVLGGMSDSKNPGLSIGEFREATRPVLRGLTEAAAGTIGDDGLETRGLISVRAGLAFQRHLEDVFPSSGIGFITQRRDEVTSEPTSYLEKMGDFRGTHALLVDPMLATGGSMLDMVNAVAAGGAEKITVVTAYTSVQGLVRVLMHPRVDLLVTTPLEAGLISPGENQNNFIYGAHLPYPMLGDFGDRYFGQAIDKEDLGIPDIVPDQFTQEEIDARFARIVDGLTRPSTGKPFSLAA